MEKKNIKRITLLVILWGMLVGSGLAGLISGIEWFKSGGFSNNNIFKPTPTPGNSALVNDNSSPTDVSVRDVSTLVNNVMPTVVSVNTEIITTSTDIFGRPTEQRSAGAGSGFVVAQQGAALYIATNEHVVSDAASITVTFANGQTVSALLKGSDANADIAVLVVDINSIPQATLEVIRIATLGDSTKICAGSFVVAIGNALGTGQSVTVGYVSAVGREVTIDDVTRTLLQTDAAINPGNSGGVLINANGEIIGINSAKYSSTEVEGIGYAIPISDAIPIITELMNREILAEKDAGYLGISGQTVTSTYSNRFGIPVGVYVNNVKNGSPADKAGIKSGDVIVAFNGISISTNEDLDTVLSYTRAGTTVTLTVKSLEKNQYVEREIEVTLGNK